ARRCRRAPLFSPPDRRAFSSWSAGFSWVRGQCSSSSSAQHAPPAAPDSRAGLSQTPQERSARPPPLDEPQRDGNSEDQVEGRATLSEPGEEPQHPSPP
ncbi:protein phosphatase 1, regulatory (inhibitor) subunit 1B, isoform CRA_e, partial [Mus musculus]